MPDSKAPQRARIVFLDWLRGLAAVIMLQGHTFHAFLRPEERESSAYYLAILLGGQAAAIFLFLTGITYGLGMNRRQTLPAAQRVWAALKRARYLFMLAILFRLQTWLFSWPKAPWQNLLHVDVLNLMGATAALLSVCALVHGRRRFRWAVTAGVLFAGLAPLMAGSWFAGLPDSLKYYFVPSGDSFAMFPWASFLAFGVAAGSVIPLVERKDWSRVMQWAALIGFAAVAAGEYFANLPWSIYPESLFWINSPSLVSCKMGITLLLASGAYLWTEYFADGWSWMRQLGTTSLAVYWVHIELVYGRWFEKYRDHLTAWGCVGVAVVLIVLMLGLSVGITQWRGRREKQTVAWPAEMPDLTPAD